MDWMTDYTVGPDGGVRPDDLQAESPDHGLIRTASATSQLS